MAGVFDTVAEEVRKRAVQGDETEEMLMRKLDRRGRIVMGLFAKQYEITSNDVAHILGLPVRQARELIRGWVEQGWLEISKSAPKSRCYCLAAE